MKTEDLTTLNPTIKFEQKGIAATKFIISPDPSDFEHALRWQELFTKAPRLLAVAEGILTTLSYPRGSEAQVRCLEEVGQDVRALIE